MKKYAPALVSLLLVAVCTCGMAGLGQPSATAIPEPDVNYSVTLTDKALVTAPAWNVACDGDTFLVGLRGKAQVAVDFAEIKAVEFSDGDQGFQNAVMTFWNGETHGISVKNAVRCTGKTDIGIMQIKVRDIRRIEFNKGTESPDEQSNK